MEKKFIWSGISIYILFILSSCQSSDHIASDQLSGKFALIHQTLEAYLLQARDKVELGLENLIRQANAENDLASSNMLINQANRLFKDSSKMLELIDQFKLTLTRDIGKGRNPQTQQINKPNENKAVREYFILEEKGYELALKLDAYVDTLNKLYSFSNEKVFERITKDEGDYIERRFGETPVVGALAVLTQIQLKIIAYQHEVLRRMHYALANAEYDFEDIWVKIVAETDTIAKGETYQANIYWDYVAQQMPRVLQINEDSISTEKGIHRFTFSPSDTGYFSLKGRLNYPSQYRDSIFTFQMNLPVKDSVEVGNNLEE